MTTEAALAKLSAPVRIDLAGGFTDNIAYLRNIPSFLSSITLAPLVHSHNRGPGTHEYVNGSGLAVSTALNALEWIRKAGGVPYLEGTSLDELAEQLCNYENSKYSIAVGKGDAYPIVFGGFNCWQCQGQRMQRVPFDISRATLDRLEKRILLVYSGIPRESTETLEQFNRSFDSGQRTYLDAFEILKNTAYQCGSQLAVGELDALGVILDMNWQAEKILAPAVTNDYLDSVYAFALESGGRGGKLSGAGGGGYFIFYTHDCDALAAAITARFPRCRPQPFCFVHESIKAINRRSIS